MLVLRTAHLLTSLAIDTGQVSSDQLYLERGTAEVIPSRSESIIHPALCLHIINLVQFGDLKLAVSESFCEFDPP